MVNVEIEEFKDVVGFLNNSQQKISPKSREMKNLSSNLNSSQINTIQLWTCNESLS